MTTERINQLVQDKDGDGLRRLLLGHADDTRQLLRIFNYLEMLPSMWLRSDGALRQLNHVWFLVFKKRYPGELLAAFEYDYYARQAEEMRADVRNEAYLVVDFLLGVNFASVKGPRPGVYGKEFFLEAVEAGGNNDIDGDVAPGAMISHAWYDIAQGNAIGPVLRPSRNDPLKWTFFHIKMRRIAFWLVHEVARTRGNEAVESLMAYASALRTKNWGAPLSAGDDVASMSENQLYEAMHRFFVVDVNDSTISSNPLVKGGHYSEAEWVQLVHEVLTRVDSEWDPLSWAQQQQSPPRLNDTVLLHFFSRRVGGDAAEAAVDDTLVHMPFIYGSDDDVVQQQQAFKAIISRTQ